MCWWGGAGGAHTMHCRFNHTVLFHPSALHSPAVGLSSANSAIWNMLNDNTGSITVNNHPMDDPRTRTSPATDVQVMSTRRTVGVSVRVRVGVRARKLTLTPTLPSNSGNSIPNKPHGKRSVQPKHTRQRERKRANLPPPLS